MDYSTINLDKLRSLPVWHAPATYHLQNDPDNGCYGDAPGYPSYFTRPVYTQRGNNPRKGAQTVITYEKVHYVVETDKTTAEQNTRLLRRLWAPLPLDRERVKLWILSTYRHLHHCYRDVERPEYGRPGTLIYPVPDYQLKSFHDDPRWNDEYRAAGKAEAEAFNKQERERATRIAVPENHLAVITIRGFYPEHAPDLDLIAHPPQGSSGDWWETEAVRPTPKTCAKSQRWQHRHPMNGNWCQWCGWRAEEKSCPGHTADTDCEIDPQNPCDACNNAEDARLRHTAEQAG